MTSEAIEDLARLVHEDYLRRRGSGGHAAGGPGAGMTASGTGGDPASGAGDGDPALAPWEELPEALRASNRAQAADIVRKLASLGLEVVPAGVAGGHALVLDDEQVEQLGRDEHRRFVEERLAAGWRLGPQRDPVARTSPTLVGWDELSEPLRDLDRDAVRLIPRLLEQAGLAVRDR